MTLLSMTPNCGCICGLAVCPPPVFKFFFSPLGQLLFVDVVQLLSLLATVSTFTSRHCVAAALGQLATLLPAGSVDAQVISLSLSLCVCVCMSLSLSSFAARGAPPSSSFYVVVCYVRVCKPRFSMT